jgi:uncharacterized protein YneF (UPF0154 family)
MRMLAFLTLALASTAASAGVYLETHDVELGVKPAPPPEVSKIYFDGGRMRSNDADGDGAIFKNKTIYALKSGDKTYTMVDKATMDRMGGQLAEARKKMEAQLAGMPPERRAMMEQMMSQMGGAPGGKQPRREVKKTGRSESVAGFKCTIWEVTLDGEKHQELCSTPASALPGGAEVLATMKEIGEMMEGLTAGLGPMAQRSSKEEWKDVAKIGGVPILTRDFDGGKASSEMRLAVIRSQPVPASTFEVPAGYKQRTMPKMGAE